MAALQGSFQNRHSPVMAPLQSMAAGRFGECVYLFAVARGSS
jgi:hypothetical protein